MFEVAEVGHEVAKRVYEGEAAELRAAVLDAQVQLVRAQRFPVIVILSGVDGAGKGEVVHLLNEWMDPRHIETHAVGAINEIERERPAMWRYWMCLPPKGKVGLFFGSWYTTPLYDRAYGKMKRKRFEGELDQIVRFENMLTSEGALIIKIWLHLSRRAQRRTLKTLQRSRDTRWRVTAEDWKNHERYPRFKRTAEEALRRTSTANAPWLIVDAVDVRYRNLTIVRTIEAAIRRRLDHEAAVTQPVAEPVVSTSALEHVSILSSLDYTQRLDKDDYKEQLAAHQAELNELCRTLKKRGRSMVLAFEGFDAAGKGGAIRRVTEAMDARQYAVIPIAAPSEQEQAMPYLWRFWRLLPRAGAVTIFDRSWYGRVLVERVEKLCTEAEWTRAYTEINDFEQQLLSHGALLAKFWISVTKEEQLRRFEARKATEFKRFKLTDEDWRNRDKWEDYERAVTDMVERTSTESAPWTLVEGDDKPFARIKVLRTLIELVRGAT